MVKNIRVTNEHARRLVEVVRASRGIKTVAQTATQMLIERAQQLGIEVVGHAPVGRSVDASPTSDLPRIHAIDGDRSMVR